MEKAEFIFCVMRGGLAGFVGGTRIEQSLLTRIGPDLGFENLPEIIRERQN